jgi:hypothetical protein
MLQEHPAILFLRLAEGLTNEIILNERSVTEQRHRPKDSPNAASRRHDL